MTGRGAHDRGRQCGGFTVEWQGVSGNDAVPGGTSVWEGIRAACPQAVLAPSGGELPAGDFDAVVVVIGESPYAEGMGDIRPTGPVRAGASNLPGGPRVLAPYGDTLELAELHPEDLADIGRARELGVPVVTVLISGRPLVVGGELASSSAFVAAWLPGSEGAGVADVLFGDRDFEGRLPLPWPEAFSAGRGCDGTLFPRGYGLRLRSS